MARIFEFVRYAYRPNQIPQHLSDKIREAASLQ